MTTRPKPVLLAILDGLALNPSSEGNAVYTANTPNLDRILTTCPHTTLVTHGPRVGLPEGQMGNSEVGHLNIGGGRVVQQELTRINMSIDQGTIGGLPAFRSLVEHVKAGPDRALHCLGLLSIGGVHSQRAHLEALISETLRQGVTRVFIHAISDGRDRPPTAAIEEIGALEQYIQTAIRPNYPQAEVAIVSLIGRYFAMDRDTRWERTEQAYALFVDQRGGESYADVVTALSIRHQSGQTDEYIEPCTIAANCSRSPRIEDGDGLLFYNFRADRMKQIVTSLFSQTFAGFTRSRVPTNLFLATLTEYEPDYPVAVLFPPQPVRNHLGQVIAQAGLSQVRIAETEKYAHVTYFFNGGEEDPVPGEARLLVPSPRDVATYDLKPQMSAEEVTAKLLQCINDYDVIILNFANCDMVGHTGSFEAAVQAVETVDRCLGSILQAVTTAGGVAIVTADHGNADQMIEYASGRPHTYHTTYPVPCIVVGERYKEAILRDGGALCDIAPTICEILGIPVPAEMTGTSLFA